MLNTVGSTQPTVKAACGLGDNTPLPRFQGSVLRHLTCVIGLCVICLLQPCSCCGQSMRYELGKRVKRFETIFGRVLSDESAKLKVLPHLQSTVSAFFTFRFRAACRHLDEATRCVANGETPVPGILALSFRPHCRLLDQSARKLDTQIRTLYGDRPAQTQRISFSLLNSAGSVIAQTHCCSDETHCSLSFTALPEGDYTLRASVGKNTTADVDQTVSVVHNLDSRLADACPESLLRRGKLSPLTGVAREWGVQLRALQQGAALETDIPAWEMLTTLEKWRRRRRIVLHQDSTRSVLTRGRIAVACRLRLNAAALSGVPKPIVIALHGAGGSENLFYEAHGAGQIVDLCAERDWLLVCPRVSPLFGLAMSVDELLGALENQGVAIDRSSVFVAGHSMGAQAAMKMSGQGSPLTAVALLGGGGAFNQSDENARTRFLVCAGEQDFGLRASQSVADALEAGGRAVRFHTYANAEHFALVQIALPDVFDFFDVASLARR